MVFYSISSNIDDVLSINPSANVFVFGDFNLHHKDWLTYSHSPAVLDVFLSSGASICSTMAFPPFGSSDHVFVSVSIDFPSNVQWDAPFIA